MTPQERVARLVGGTYPCKRSASVAPALRNHLSFVCRGGRPRSPRLPLEGKVPSVCEADEVETASLHPPPAALGSVSRVRAGCGCGSARVAYLDKRRVLHQKAQPLTTVRGCALLFCFFRCGLVEVDIFDPIIHAAFFIVICYGQLIPVYIVGVFFSHTAVGVVVSFGQ